MSRKTRRTRKHRPRGQRTGNYPSGKIELHKGGFGFVDTDEGSFFIPPKSVHGALPGDIVEVRPARRYDPQSTRRNGSVARVLRRDTEYLVGVLEVNDPVAVVVSQDPRVLHDLFVTDAPLPPDARDGDVVLARITEYPQRHQPMQGYVVEVLGQADAPGMGVDIIIHNAGLATEFSVAALEEAAAAEVDADAALREPGRRDLRERCVFTIDPTDAKDFDDAVSVDRVEGCLRLGVHIADVSAYVPWEGHVDIAARDRATSVYLVDRVLPMLPETLSNDVCSLRPGIDRLTMTCDMYFDGARLMRHEIYPSVIRSRRRFTYGQAADVLEGTLSDDLAPKLKALHELAQTLLAARIERGALDFDTVEAKPVLDEYGAVERVDLRTKTAATSMIEEAMIAANETVAAHLLRVHRPCVYRVHESPRPASLETLLPVLKELGYPIAGLGSGDAKAYQRILDAAKGRPEEPLVNAMVLRSMERAHYSVDCQPHFGLASEAYCHFTSPIRRYPDLMVHRLLKDAHAMEGQLEWLAQHSSRMERIAEEAENDSVTLKLAERAAQHVGEVVEGGIAALSARSLHVRFDDTLEGIVRFDAVKDEHHSFDARAQVLVGDESGRTYRIGQRVRVRIGEVRVNERQVFLSLV